MKGKLAATPRLPRWLAFAPRLLAFRRGPKPPLDTGEADHISQLSISTLDTPANSPKIQFWGLLGLGCCETVNGMHRDWCSTWCGRRYSTSVTSLLPARVDGMILGVRSLPSKRPPAKLHNLVLAPENGTLRREYFMQREGL